MNLNIKIPIEVHKRLKVRAALEGVTIKELATRAIEEYCDKKENEEKTHTT